MTTPFKIFKPLALLAAAVSVGATFATEGAIDLKTLKLEPGFRLSLFSENVENARQLAVSPAGTVFAGSREAGKVYALPDANHDFKADEVIVLAKDLKMPSGITFRNGSLYIATIGEILVFENIEAHLREKDLKPKVLYDKLPTDEHHGWKYIDFGPDGWLYIPVGMPCNVCKKSDPRYGTILRWNPDKPTQPAEIYASGIRNTVGFGWHPQTRHLWFTDNGRDMLGDDIPPEELNVATQPGMNFGFPFCRAGEIPDPEFGKEAPCTQFQKPLLKMPAHVAPLGIVFWNNRLLIAEHGSWNRFSPIGYRISQVSISSGQKVSDYRPFLEGWLGKEGVQGRPVAFLILKDQSLLISDDEKGRIYRVEKL